METNVEIYYLYQNRKWFSGMRGCYLRDLLQGVNGLITRIWEEICEVGDEIKIVLFSPIQNPQKMEEKIILLYYPS